MEHTEQLIILFLSKKILLAQSSAYNFPAQQIAALLLTKRDLNKGETHCYGVPYLLHIFHPLNAFTPPTALRWTVLN